MYHQTINFNTSWKVYAPYLYRSYDMYDTNLNVYEYLAVFIPQNWYQIIFFNISETINTELK
jgi:hypothetical protein